MIYDLQTWKTNNLFNLIGIDFRILKINIACRNFTMSIVL
jgi:hypothetical protein